MSIHLLAAMPWTAVRDLASPRALAILPVGAMEAHGPHLPVAADIVIAEAMAREGANRLSARGFDVLVLPTLPFATAPFAADFPGTINLSSDAVTTIVVSVAASLARHGIHHTVLANAHLDPAHVTALRKAEAQVTARGSARVIFPDVTKRRWAERLTDEFRSGACHAGRYETSILLAERPEWVRREIAAKLPGNPRSLSDAIREGQHTFGEAGGSEAYFGYPADASAEEGRQIVEMLGRILEDAVAEHAGELESERPERRT